MKDKNLNYKSFDEVLRTFLIKNEEERSKGRDNDWWYASDLGLCKRKQFLRRLGLQETNEKEFRIRFVAMDGIAGHNWREEAAKKMGVLIASEERLQNDALRFKGRFDLLIWLDKKPVIVDIKTQRSEAFFRRAKLPSGQRVKEFQKMQLASYCLFAKQKYPKLKIEEARIYYVDRGGGVREEYVFHFGKQMFDKVLKELNDLNKYWKDKTLPPIEKSWLCRYCPWKTVCSTVDKDKLNLNQIINLYGKPKIKRREEGNNNRKKRRSKNGKVGSRKTRKVNHKKASTGR